MKVFIIVLCLDVAAGARILGVVPTPSYSHQIVFQPLWRELSLRGHQVVTITTDPINEPRLTNLTEIDCSASYAYVRKLDMVKLAKAPLKMANTLIDLLFDAVDDQLVHPQVRNLIENENEHFDLVIMEALFITPVAFSKRFNCPYILMTIFDAPMHVYYSLGNPAHPVLNPDLNLPFFGELNFFQRLTSVAYVVITKLYIRVTTRARVDKQIEKHFGEGHLTPNDMFSNASMLFVNINPIFHDIKALLPNIILIGGGIHLKTSDIIISKELQQKLDEREFIYFSLGTNVQVAHLSKELVDSFMKTFAELPFTVLWKCELGELPGKPNNVIMSKWFPQQRIFKHKNIKLFVTQGGHPSMEEAIYNHIPMVGIPIFADQYTNVKKMVDKGLGLGLDFKSLGKDTFKKTILEVITDPKYRNRVKELATLAKDEPMTGLEKAVWWTEYVIRHKGAKHLKSPATDLPLYQYFLLDVIAFCLLVITLLVAVALTIIKITLKTFKRLTN